MQRLLDALGRTWRALVDDPSGRMLLLGLGAGLVGGLAAGAFDAVRAALGALMLGTSDISVTPTAWWRVLLFPVLGGAAAGALLQTSRLERPVGMAQLIEGVQLRSGGLSLREGVVTALAAVFALGSGHSGGREAPMAGLSASIAHAIGDALRIRVGELRVLVAATGAAAIAASFNTPLGSAILALELILGSFALRHFGPVVAATVTGTLVGQALLGDRVAFHTPGFALDHWAELFAYAVLGAVCGVVAAGFQAAILAAGARSDQLGFPLVVRGALGGLVVGLLGVVGLHGVMGTGYALIERVLTEPATLGLPMLLALGVGKVVATSATFAGRSGPGLFSPLLVVGALTGAGFGLAMEAAFPGSSLAAGSYGLVAMGAVTAASLRSPLAMILVLFELTGDYAVVPTTMLTVAVAIPVAHALAPGSLYDALLGARGVRLHREVPPELRAKTVGDLMATEGYVVVPSSSVLHDLVAAFGKTRENLLWMVDAEGRYVAAVNVQDVLDALSSTRLQPEMRMVLPVLKRSQPAGDGITLLASLEVDEVPVVDAEGKLVGVLHERSLLAALEAHPLPSPRREPAEPGQSP